MAGRPRRRAMLARLEQRTRAEFLDEPEATHLDYVELWQASGRTLNKLAAELSAPITDSGRADTGTLDCNGRPADASAGIVSGEMISRYLYTTFGADATETRLSRARARGAHRLNDETIAIADGLTAENTTPVDIGAARLRISARQWTAERWNAAEFGQAKGTSVSISIGQLHLQALLAVPTKVTGASDFRFVPENNTTDSESGNRQVVVGPALTALD